MEFDIRMNKSMSLVAGLSLSACASIPTGPMWNATEYYDEFTEEKYCRVQPYVGRKLYYTALSHSYVFFAENKDGEIRAGFRSDRNYPVVGDIQIKIGSKLVVMTANDTPIDNLPKQVQLDHELPMANTINKVTENVTKLGSPYRAFQGEKAIELLNDIYAYDGDIKYRTVSINKALSSTGAIQVDESFKVALDVCKISIESK